MRRLGIFVFYDKDGIVDRYVETLINSFKDIFADLIIVINGDISQNAYSKLKKYARQVYCRENIGFDAGAYRDLIIEYLGWEQLYQYDEVTFFNDTFYAPLYPWKIVYERMKEQNVDFWGITKHQGGYFENDFSFGPHLQSYFLVVRRNLLIDKAFVEFWTQLSYPTTHRKAISEFEIKFTSYFVERGFKYISLLETYGFESVYGQNPYGPRRMKELLEYHIPVIKKKGLAECKFKDINIMLEHITANTDYDIEMIIENMLRVFPNSNFTNYIIFEKFLKAHEKIYIYGAGIWGNRIAEYLSYREYENIKFVVTKKEENNEKVLEFSELELTMQDGMILALGQEAFAEVYPMVKGKVQEENMLLPELFKAGI